MTGRTNRRTFVLTIILIIAASAAFAAKTPPTFRDVAYGPLERDVLDFWQAESDTPTPVVVFIHGGGFYQGSKNGASESYIKKCRENGVSYAAINYPYYQDVALLGIIRDNIARAVQFLRYKSDEWNIDKNAIAVYGSSAGAGSSLWLAFHDDIADPDNADPVLRESSRVSAAVGIRTQATYDFAKWFKYFKGEMDAKTLRAWKLIFIRTVVEMYHVETEKQLNTPEIKEVRRELDMLTMMDANDPPVLVQTFTSDGPKGDMLHHPVHPRTVMKQAANVGANVTMNIDETPKDQRTDPLDFMLKYLK